MSGLSDYSAENYLNDMAGVIPAPTSNNARYLALFTTAPTSDAGTGGTEVSGGSYARVQVAGAIAAGGAISTGSATITMSGDNPGWVVPGMNVYSITAGKQIGTVSSWSTSSTTLTLTGNASNNGSGSSDSLLFSAFGAASASSGSEPDTAPANITTGAIITFAQATADWGTITSFGLYDALSSGNLRGWDYLGAFTWIPFTCTNANPGVLTADTAADAPANGSSIVVTEKYGGTLPTTGGSWSGLLTTANLSGATFTAGVHTTSIGGGTFRQVTSFGPIGNGVVASFAAGQLTITSA
jgi:hypothetical protein